MAVSEEWEPLDVTVDSGAFDSVANKKTCSGIRVKRTEKTGKSYTAANGTGIPIYGEKRITGQTDNNGPSGVETGMRFTIAEVKRPLGAVREMLKKGKRVVFDEEGSYIEHKKTGRKTGIVYDWAMYVLQIRVHKNVDFAGRG